MSIPATRTAILAFAVLFVINGLAPVAAQPPDGQGGRGEGRGFGMPPRDTAAAQQLAVGTSSISGVILVAGSAQPARRARVTLNAADSGGGGGGTRMTTSDDDGRFSFVGLPAGRYTLSATKQGHIGVTYGQTYPGRPGTPIQLANGEKFAAMLQMPKGSVLTGTVFDEFGEPTPGTQVRAMRYVMQSGRRTLQQSGSGSTDDRGIYRIFGLQPGEYVVSAAPRNIGPAIDAARVQAELQAVRQRIISTGIDEMAVRELAERAAVLQSQLPQQEEQASGYAPVYYPGTSSAAQAEAVTLAVGEERGNIDFQLQRVPMARLEGIVVNATGEPVQGVQLTLMEATQTAPGVGGNAARADDQGRFTMTNVAPGNYRLVARASGSSTGRGAALAGGRGGRGAMQATGVRLWGSVDVPVDGRSLTNIIVPLQAGLPVTGRITFNATAAQAPSDLSRLRVTLTPADPSGLSQAVTGTVDEEGRFTVASVLPGWYRLSATGAGSGWVLESATVGGEDTLDFPFEVRPGQAVSGADIVFTDRRAQLSGAITTQNGQPAPGFTLILFAADDRYWGPQSRRIRTTRPATSGQFLFADLPPGEYKLVAMADVEPGAWFDPAFLQQIDAASMRIVVRDGEHKVQHLQVANPRIPHPNP
jgi:hypothetical protein